MSTPVRLGLFAAGGLASLAFAAIVLSALPRRTAARNEAAAAVIPTTPKTALASRRPVPLAPLTVEPPPKCEAPRPATELRGPTEKESLSRLLSAPVVAFDRSESRTESRDAGTQSESATLASIDRRADLAGLPIRRGKECRQTEAAARILGEQAGNLRRWTLNPVVLEQNLRGRKGKVNSWLKAEAVPALMQVLMTEDIEVREILAGHLGRIKGREATAALIRLALHDLSPRIRITATAGLSKRPSKDYAPHLLRGFDHPWPVIAENAARAVVALRPAGARGALEKLLQRPDPSVPYRRPNRKTLLVKEMVRVHHLSNCLLCHPSSTATGDPVRGLVPEIDQRGLVPDTDQPAPAPAVYYGSSGQNQAIFVRADITYLEQDFSALLPVDRPGLGSAEQRFDFLVRERAATPQDIAASRAREGAGPSAHRRAILFALGELSAPPTLARR